VIALYAFTLELAQLPKIEGIDGAPLMRFDLDSLTAVGSRHDGPLDGEPRTQALAQGLVVEALTALAAAVLPVRFGETFADARALAAAVRERRGELGRALERVRGCAEIGVRITGNPDGAPASDATSGTAYMRARLADETRAGALHEQLTPVARAATVPRSGEATYLVERARIADALRTVERFAGLHPEVSVSCSGPWAPYSFGSEA